jgi:parallel beta-helix repeat protein
VTRATWMAGDDTRTTPEKVTPVIFPRAIEVTNSGDAGPGSLRSAIESANANCAGIACELVFRLGVPAPAVILPNTPLPPITAPDLTVNGGEEKVVLEGAALWFGNGLVVEGAGVFTIRNLIIRNFPWDGIAVRRNGSTSPWRSSISDSLLLSNGSRGLTFDGLASAVDVERNAMAHNARSGVFIAAGAGITLTDNDVFENRASGVYVSDTSRSVILTRNSLRSNAH